MKHGPNPSYTEHLTLSHAVDILQGFKGILQVDGYAGYNRVLDLWNNAPIQLAYC
jgi:transposase